MSPALSSVDMVAEYTSLFAQCFSPDGQLLAVGNHLGKIVIYSLEQIVQRSRDEVAEEKPSQAAQLTSTSSYFVQFWANEVKNPVLSLISNPDHLIVGTQGEICGWTWTSIKKKSPKQAWCLPLPRQPGTAIETDANYMALNSSSQTAGHLIVAAGDHQVHVYDLETRLSVMDLRGHGNYIHSVSHCPQSNMIASASEDGSVRLWDVRRKNPNTSTLVPSDKEPLCRPSLGKWVGAVSLNSDWLACGGGPRAAVWHLRTMSPNEALPPDDNGVHEIKIQGDRVLIGGQMNMLYQANLSGEVQSVVPVSSSCIYSIVCQEAPIRILTCSGSSSKIDVCAPNFSYKDQTIAFPI